MFLHLIAVMSASWVGYLASGQFDAECRPVSLAGWLVVSGSVAAVLSLRVVLIDQAS